uniref:U1-myrmicitoxin-Mr1a n=1 Tax=Myrmica rubra TaxID=106198 RepID=TX1A_MYRRB|nr:RecName: Full=U1-myrmicitoxin-Mr1a; Short=U1-MYRTX-Mr1a; AltName: Full=U-myrmicitoxin-MRArub1; Short=U-MYRTX-MRArub1 [Myrmica rubra]
IDPKLLESLA